MPPKTHYLWLRGDCDAWSQEAAVLSKDANRYPKFRRYLIGDPQGGAVQRKRQCREGENLLVGCFVVEGNMGVYSACSRLTEEDSLRPPWGVDF